MEVYDIVLSFIHHIFMDKFLPHNSLLEKWGSHAYFQVEGVIQHIYVNMEYQSWKWAEAKSLNFPGYLFSNV